MYFVRIPINSKKYMFINISTLFDIDYSV